ncbi:YveK family protein [Alicyclobacillus fructus]|uniref:YveK family protein n=1 Tax=Alicyclobacillus fructus TaxID=2816082 RepID=UPI001A902CA9|nr:Wzz/FepE/Etk N-terminal domain-containing protein [Alicyclobacillus fructus]
MEENELLHYWRVIRRNWLPVVIIPIVAAVVSGLLSFFVLHPQYEADTTLLVNQPQNSAAQMALEYDSIMANQALVNTYSAIIKSNSIESSVIDELHLPYTTAQLDKMITVSSPTQSQVIDVKVIAPNEAQAVSIANALATTFQHRAAQLMNVENVQIVDRAVVQPNAKPVKPNKKLNVAVAFILGLIVGIGVAFLREYLDYRIRTPEDAERLLQLPVLGVVEEYRLG